MNKQKIIKGDVVKVIAGSHKGKQGPVLKLSKDKKRVYVEGVSAIKHFKPTQTDSEGGIREIPAAVDISNVAIIDPKNKNSFSKIGYQITDDKKIRIARKSKAPLK
ncbi:50S ribosomal protein L24 [Spiroplasma endosymbiont of Panorpa germanica]|uniref:50S ribosomal protein L24 n=1 Tax=Spiroplasma endosymbiont of Panorpa germanica TaxID=3066314 RepID=UPI0030CE1ABC